LRYSTRAVSAHVPTMLAGAVACGDSGEPDERDCHRRPSAAGDVDDPPRTSRRFQARDKPERLSDEVSLAADGRCPESERRTPLGCSRGRPESNPSRASTAALLGGPSTHRRRRRFVPPPSDRAELHGRPLRAGQRRHSPSEQVGGGAVIPEGQAGPEAGRSVVIMAAHSAPSMSTNDPLPPGSDAAKTDLRVADAAKAWLVDADSASFGDRDYAAVLRHILSQRKERAKRHRATRISADR
jgi:hypothetical protein